MLHSRHGSVFDDVGSDAGCEEQGSAGADRGYDSVPPRSADCLGEEQVTRRKL